MFEWLTEPLTVGAYLLAHLLYALTKVVVYVWQETTPYHKRRQG